MRRTFCLALSLLLPLVAFNVSRADDQADAAAIVEKGLKAVGGREKVAKYKASTWKETGTYQTDGWITVTFPLSDFNYTFNGANCSNKLSDAMLRGVTFYVWNGGVAGKDCNPHICIDNIRVVPK
jgi:hypothetical protein